MVATWGDYSLFTAACPSEVALHAFKFVPDKFVPIRGLALYTHLA